MSIKENVQRSDPSVVDHETYETSFGKGHDLLPEEDALISPLIVDKDNAAEEGPSSFLEPQPNTTTHNQYVPVKFSGVTLDVYNDYMQGMSPQELALKYEPRRLSYARRNLLALGKPAPDYLAKKLDPPIDQINDPKTSLEQLKELIKNFNTVRGVLKYSSGENPILTQLTIIQEAAWGVADPQKTARAQAVLESSGVPNMAVESYSGGKKIGTYRFTFTRTADLAVEELEKNQDIAFLPIRKSA